jgi:hypothetical protein
VYVLGGCGTFAVGVGAESSLNKSTSDCFGYGLMEAAGSPDGDATATDRAPGAAGAGAESSLNKSTSDCFGYGLMEAAGSFAPGAGAIEPG